MNCSDKGKALLAGMGAGVANGFFGGGGGMVLLPLFHRWCGLGQRKTFATSLVVILPLCLLSSVIYLFRGDLDFSVALPYLLGGLVGGFLGGKTFQRRNMTRLRRLFALLLLYGGVRALFF